jgi:hypothetical protein
MGSGACRHQQLASENMDQQTLDEQLAINTSGNQHIWQSTQAWKL